MKTVSTFSISTELTGSSLLKQILYFDLLKPEGLRDESTSPVTNRYEALKASLGVGTVVPVRLGRLPLFIPSWQQSISKQQGQVSSRSAYLLSIAALNRLPLDEEASQGIPEDYGERAIQNIRTLTRILIELQNDDLIAADDFADFFSLLRPYGKDLYETVMQGLDLYFAEDYLPAAYVLTLQLEDYLRHLYQATGLSSKEQTSQGLTEKPLGRILQRLSYYLPEDVYHYLFWILKDYRGLNLRNAIAHGFFKKSDTHPTLVVAIIHVFCLVISSINQSNSSA